MHKRMFTAVLLLAIAVAGCGKTKTEEPKEKEIADFTSMEEEPNLSYEVPVSVPGILVNQLGYMTDSAKVAVFKGSELPQEFHVIDAESGEVVYTGYPKEKVYSSELAEYNAYGDFSSLTQAGNYYIEAPVLGRSYTFTIADDAYEDVFRESCKQYYYNRCGMTLTEQYAGEHAHNACHTGKAVLREDISVSLDVSGGWHQDEKGQKDVIAAARTMSVMMMAYELYGEAFSDDTGIPESGNGIPDILDEVRYEVEWLLKMQDQRTGAVYSGVTIYQQNGNNPGKTTDIYVEPATPEAEKAFAMAIAKFSYLYQRYDAEYATACLKAADRAFKYAELDRKNETDPLGFAAAAELYRAAGKETFHRYVTGYLAAGKMEEEKDEITLIGCVTYISTTQPVNIPLCERIMNMLMDEAEKILNEASDSVYMTGGDKQQDNNELLLNMMYLSVMNHIASSKEYENVIENHLHFFLGRNDQAVSYIEGAGDNSCDNIGSGLGIMKQFEADSKLIFMLSEIREINAR